MNQTVVKALSFSCVALLYSRNSAELFLNPEGTAHTEDLPIFQIIKVPNDEECDATDGATCTAARLIKNLIKSTTTNYTF